MSKNGKSTNWARNFGQSIKFSAIDILNDVAPSMSEFTKNNSETISEVVKEMRNIRSGQKKMFSMLDSSPFMKYSAEGFKNAMDDLKSGKFNNKEREEALFDNGDDFDDFSDDGFDFDMGGGDSSSPIVNEINVGNDPVVRNAAMSARQNVIATSRVNQNVVKQTRIVAEGFDNTNAVNKQLAVTGFTMNKMMHEQSMNMYENINKNLGSMIEFNNETMSKFAMGALKFYDDNLIKMDTLIDEVRKINVYGGRKDGEEEEEKQKPQYKQLFSNRGGFNLKNYPDLLKSNILRATEEDPILQSVKEFVTNDEALKMLAANPLGQLSSFIAGSLVPITIKKYMGRLDESFSQFFPSLFMKINRHMDSDNPIISAMAKMFGIQTDVRLSPDFASYDKGSMPYNGLAQKSLVDVIPNYLSKILSAITGREEIAFDHEEGRFTTKKDLRDKLNDNEMSRLTSPFSKIIREMTKQIEESVVFRTDKDRENLFKDMNVMMKGMALSGKGFNPLKDRIEDFGVEGANANILKAAFMNLSRGKQMSTSLASLRGRQDQIDWLDDIYKGQTGAGSNLFSIFGGLKEDEFIDRNANDETKYKRKKELFGGGIDKYGNSQLDYLLDIKEILLEGINVFPQQSDRSGRRRNNGGNNSPIVDRLGNYKRKKSRQDNDLISEENDELPVVISDEERDEQIANGKIYSGDFGRKDSKELQAQLKFNADSRTGNDDNRNGGLYGIIDRYVNRNTFGEKINSIKESIEEFFKSPIKLFTGALDKMDNALYTIIYGDENGDSIVKVAISSMKNTFNNFNTWMKKKYGQAKDFLFGEEGLTNTKVFKWMKQKSSTVMDYIFGKKVGSDGGRQGGVLSGAFNNVGDIFKQVRHSMFGTSYKDSTGKETGYSPNSVFGEIKNGILAGFKNMKVHLFGPDKTGTDGKKVPFVDQVYDTLGTGYNNFKNFFFGAKTSTEEGKKEFKAIMEDFKGKMPKALAYGIIGAGVATFTNFGILGSLFLPGGPVGGALLGTAVGLLSQSDKFKNWLFGPQGQDGSRMGGVISKSVIGFFSKNKTAIIGGATFGAVKGLINASGMLKLMGTAGYMASWVLPGGPIAGALMGAALGIATSSATFKSFLYGKPDKDGKRTGGIISKKYSESMKKHMPNMAFGALSFGVGGAVLGQMGIMGAMMTPAGPIGAAIMGAATGIAISSNKFRRYLFGSEDEKTGLHKAGLFDKISNVFKLSIVEPFKLKLEKISFGVEKWFTKSIANPFRDALEPLKTQFKVLTDSMKDLFVNGWKSVTTYIGTVFEKHVGKPFGRFMEENVMKPLRGFMGRLVNGLGKVFGAVLSSPVKALSMIAMSMQHSQEEKGLRQERGERSNHLKNSIGNFINGTGNAEGTGIWDNFKSLAKSYYNKEDIEKGKSRIATYREKEANRIAERDRNQEIEFAKRQAELEDKTDKLKNRRQRASDIDFDTSYLDKNGNLQDSKMLYDMTSDISNVSDSIIESNTILNRIKNIIGGFAARMTGNKDFIGDSAGTDPIAPTSKENKDMKTLSNISFSDYYGHYNDSSNVSPIVGMDQYSSDPLINSMMSQFNQIPPVAGSTGIKNGTKYNFNRIGNRRLSSINGPVITSSNTPGIILNGGADDNSVIVAQNNLNSSMGQIDQNGNRIDSNSVNGQMKGTKQSRSQLNSSNNLGGATALSYLKIIATNVDGQLDGVGSNVYKSRKLLESISGVNSDDITGSNNKDRLGFWGKMKQKAMMMIFHPMVFLGELIMKPFKMIFGVVNKIVNIGFSIVNGIMSGVETLFNGAKAIGKVMLDTVIAIPKMAFQIVKGVAEAAKELVIGGVKILTTGVLGLLDNGFKLIGAGIRSIGSIAEGVAGMAKGLFIGLGKMGGELLTGVAKGIKGVFSLAMSVGETVLDMSKTVFKTVGGLVVSGVEAIGNITSSAIKGIGSLLTTVTKTLFSVITSPFKFLGNLLTGKLGGLNKVYVTGGKLDLVEKVETVVIVEKLKEAPENKNHSNTIESNHGIILPNSYNGRRTASYMNAVREIREEREATQNNENKQTSFLEKILNVGREHKNLFSDMLTGIKKYLFGFLLIAGPAIAGLWKWLQDKFKTDERNNKSDTNPLANGVERQDNQGNVIRNSNMMERYGTGIGSVIAAKALGFNQMAPLKAIGSVGNYVGKTVANAASMVRHPLDTGSKIISSVKNIGGDLINSARSTMDSGILVKFNKMKETAMNMIEKFMASSEIGKAIGKGGSSGIATKLSEIIKSKFTVDLFKANMGKLSTALAKTLGSISNPIGWAYTGIVSLWNVTTGWNEAANLFRVSEDAVDYKMKAISCIVKGIAGCPWMALTDLILTLVIGLTGVDYRQVLAELMYGAVADDDSTLKASQDNFKSQWQDYASKGNKDMSFDAYNDMKNKTAFDTVSDWISGGWAGIKNMFGVKKTPDFVGAGEGDGAMSIFDKTSEIVGDIGGMTFKFWTDAKNIMASNFSNISKSISDMLGNLNNKFGQVLGFKDENGKDVSFTEKVSNVAGSAWNSAKNIGSTVWDYVKSSGSKIKNFFTGGGNNKQFIGGSKDSKGEFVGGSEDMLQGFPYFSQYDGRWGETPYGSHGTIGTSGCGPTSMAMVGSALTGRSISPDEMANYSVNNGFRVENGTSWGFFDSAAKNLGLSSVSVTNNAEAIGNNLRAGYPVILGGENPDRSPDNPFTKSGHFVVATGVNSDNSQMVINDPRGPEYSHIYDSSKVVQGLGSDGVAVAFTGSNGSSYDVSRVQGKMGSNSGKSPAKPKRKGMSELIGDIGSIFSTFASSVVGGKIYKQGDYQTSSDDNGAGINVSGGDNVKKVWNFLTGNMKLSPKVASGIMGNIQAESSFDTKSISSDGANSLGLCQWTDSRRTALENLAAKRGTDPTDINTQLEYLGMELGNYSETLNNMESANSPGDAAYIFGKEFERPNEVYAHWDRRRASADKFFSDGTRFAGAGFVGAGESSMYRGTPYMQTSSRPYSSGMRYGNNKRGGNPISNVLGKLFGMNNGGTNNSSNIVNIPNKNTEKPVMNNIKSITPKSIIKYGDFKGGEYFNDVDNITKEASAYVKGKGDLLSVAKSIGFAAIPSDDTPLTADQQAQLGFREYNPIRTWAHYTVDSELWRDPTGGNGKTSVESWLGVNYGEKHVDNKKSSIIRPTTTNKFEEKKDIIDTQMSSPKTKEVIHNMKSQSTKDGNSNGINDLNDLMEKAVSLLEKVASSNDNIDKGIVKLNDNQGKIILDNGRGTQTEINVSRNNNKPDTGNSDNKTITPEYKYNRDIVSGGTFATKK